MKKIIGVVAVVIAVSMVAALYAGVLPLSAMGNLNTTTSNRHFGNFLGHDELLGPNGKEGYISSWKENGFSETISVIAKLKLEQQGITIATGITRYGYSVYGYVGTEWIELSTPDKSTMYLTGTNPGLISVPSGIQWDGVVNFNEFAFNIVGSEVKGIRVEAWFYMNWDVFNPFEGYKWVKMQSDEAYMYSGYGGLYLPRGLEEQNPDLPYSTFEIGEVVKIGVETAKGGETSDGMPWRVTLNAPYTGANPDMDPGAGGGVIKEQAYADDCSASNTFFSFTVTEAMAQATMDTGLPYTVRIWNTILPLGTLNIDFIDFYYNAPGKVEFTGPETAEVDETIVVSLTSTLNADTQADIDFFRVSVVYGKADTLLPSDWGDGRWIVHTTDVGTNDGQACSLPRTISFSAESEGYVTVFAKVFDVNGRPSLTTQTWTLYVWMSEADGGSGQPPSDVTDPDTGQDDYGGGHTSPWLPWDPSDSPWYNTQVNEILTYIIMALVIVMFAILAFALPLPFAPFSRILVFLVGLLLATLLYFFPPW